MAENPSLADVINDAVSEWARGADGSLMTNFLFVAEFLEADDGRPTNLVLAPDRASQASVLGLATYALNLLTECQRRDVLAVVYGDDFEGGDDE